MSGRVKLLWSYLRKEGTRMWRHEDSEEQNVLRVGTLNESTSLWILIFFWTGEVEQPTQGKDYHREMDEITRWESSTLSRFDSVRWHLKSLVLDSYINRGIDSRLENPWLFILCVLMTRVKRGAFILSWIICIIGVPCICFGKRIM